LEQRLRANGQWFHPHPWLMTYVGEAQIASVVRRELAELQPGDLGDFGQITLAPFRRQAVTSPLLRLPEDDVCYAFNLVRIPTTNSTAEADRLVQANRAAYDRIRAAGGTLYPVSAFPMAQDDWRRHFGAAWGRLRDAKQQFDPAHVLTPGYEVF
jgi:FAD/FMN-containing dehydrogenase